MDEGCAKNEGAFVIRGSGGPRVSPDPTPYSKDSLVTEYLTRPVRRFELKSSWWSVEAFFSSRNGLEVLGVVVGAQTSCTAYVGATVTLVVFGLDRGVLK